MFMLGLGPIIVVHNRTGTSFSAREIASDHWCRPKIDRLLYIARVGPSVHEKVQSYCEATDLLSTDSKTPAIAR